MSSTKRYPSIILATACIPWNEHYEFDEVAFRSQIKAFLERGVNHIYLFGTAGEGYAVTEEQHDRIIEVFVEEMTGPDCQPMIGLISLSLATMMRRIDKARSLGIRDFQFALPSWGALSEKELFMFFHTICDSYPDCRFLHYNLLRAKRVVTPEEYCQLAAEIPNFAGAKYSTDDATMIYRLLSKPSPLQFFFSETGFAIGSMFGECGLLISVANSNLSRAWIFFNAAARKDHKVLLDTFSDMMGIVEGLFSVTGETKIDGAYDKILYRTLDASFPLRMAAPYSANTDEQSDKYRLFLQERYPQWLETVE